MAAFVEDLLNSRLVRRHMPVAVLAFGLVLCAWLMGSRLRALTHFSASIHTRNISFVAGHRTNTAGLFNSGSYPVDIVLHSRCRITSFDGPIPRDTGETLALRKVRLMGLDIAEGSHVDLAVIEGFLRVRLTRPAIIKDAIAIIRLDRGSEVQGDALLNQYAHRALPMSSGGLARRLTGRSRCRSIFSGSLRPPSGSHSRTASGSVLSVMEHPASSTPKARLRCPNARSA